MRRPRLRTIVGFEQAGVSDAQVSKTFSSIFTMIGRSLLIQIKISTPDGKVHSMQERKVS